MLELIDRFFEGLKKAREVAKKIQDAELQNVVADLMRDSADLKMEIATLRDEMARTREERDELARRVDFRGKVTFKNGVYFLGQPVTGYGPGPYCPVCFDADSKLISLTVILQQSKVSTTMPLPVANGWQCGICKTRFSFVEGSVG